MVAWRFGIATLLVVVLEGCGGQTAKPASPNLPTAEPTRPAVDKATTDTSDVRSKDPVNTVAATLENEPAAERPLPPVQPEVPFQIEDGFTLLTFADFEAFGAEAETWESTAEGVKCSGKPRGYLYSKQPFQNFTLRLDYRFPRPQSLKDDTKFKGNTGFLVYVTGEHKLWPVCLEVQGKHIQMGAIKENGGAQPVVSKDDDAARQKARHPVGQWNSLEIVSDGGAVAVTLNGTPISQCEPNFLSEGLIGIQAEDHPFEVRRIRIRRN